MSKEETVHRFDESRALNYDDKIRLLSPGYEVLHHAMNKLLSVILPAEAHVLVVGAGTGMDIVTCGKAHPEWTFTAVDPSAEMIALCRENVAAAGLSGRVRFHLGYAEDLSVADFDAATSIFVSHFIEGEKEKLGYLASISSRLKASAPLVIADLHGDRTQPDFEILLSAWRDYYDSLGVGREETERAFAYIERDISFIPENRLFGLLEEAGFGETFAFFRVLLFGGWISRKLR